MTEKIEWVMSPKGREETNWGGARPGAGRPKVRRLLELTAEQVAILVAALETYSNDNFSTSDDYDPEPLQTLRALVDELAGIAPLPDAGKEL